MENRSNLLVDEELLETLTRVAELLFDPDNWDLGELDETSMLAPAWQEGGFNVDRLGKP